MKNLEWLYSSCSCSIVIVITVVSKFVNCNEWWLYTVSIIVHVAILVLLVFWVGTILYLIWWAQPALVQLWICHTYSILIQMCLSLNVIIIIYLVGAPGIILSVLFLADLVRGVISRSLFLQIFIVKSRTLNQTSSIPLDATACT